MKKQVFVIAILFVHGFLLGQTATKSRWNLSLGWTESYIADHLASPLLYTSDVLDIGLGFHNHKENPVIARLQLSIGTQQAIRTGQRSGVFVSTADLNALSETHDFKVNPFLSRFGGQFSLSKRWKINTYHSLGGQCSTRYLLAGIAGDDWQYEQADFAVNYGYNRKIFKGDLNIELSLPLLAYVVRPPFSIDPSLPDETNYFKGYLRTGSSLTSIHKFVNPEFLLTYDYPFKEGKYIGFGFQISWTSFPEPKALRMLEYGLQARYSF